MEAPVGIDLGPVVTVAGGAEVKGECTITLNEHGLAFFFCQLEHGHDAVSCVPAWITLGEN